MNRSCLSALVVVALTSGFGFAAPAESQPEKQAIPMHEVTDSLLPSGVYNVVTYAAPHAVKLADLGLREAGLRGGPVFRAADEIRIFASRDQMEGSPKARLWLNTRENAWWYHTGGEGAAEAFELQPGEVMIILTRASTEPIAWKNPLR